MQKFFSPVTLILIVLFSCSDADDNPTIEELPEGTNFRINHFTRLCQGIVQQQCLLVQEDDLLGTKDWNFFYSDIAGFDFEEGFVYNLKVKKTNIENAPQDGSSIRYELVEIISKTPATCQFENAVTDLDWLRIEIEQRAINANAETQYCYITQAEYNGDPVFLYWDCNPFVNKVILIFDCLGNGLSYLGDTITFEDLENQRIIWKPENFTCQVDF